MKTGFRSNGTLSAALLAIAGSCGGTEAAGSSKQVAEAPLFPEDAPPVPSEEQAAKDASARINADNADAELEKLKKELEDG